jgi:hypothetical protein
MTGKKTPTAPKPSQQREVTKGYIPAPQRGEVRGGYQGPTGTQSAPPTTGSSITPPKK